MEPVIANIYTHIPEQLPEEMFECLLKSDQVIIERIISKGHITARGHWYDQEWDEWILVLQGKATLMYENDNRLITLVPGDYVLIPAHTRHRVVWTQPDLATLWLAVLLHKPKESLNGNLSA
ncbi:MAG: cupin domain-containing protein [Methylobacter sp.]|nr:cupin domain-containing protein [Methylobacter sp.]